MEKRGGEGPGVWLDLKNIRKMYLRAYSTPLPDGFPMGFPLPWQKEVVKGFMGSPYEWLADGSLRIPDENLGFGLGTSLEDNDQRDNPFAAPPDEQKKCVVFVHGIDLDVPTQLGYAESFYKRLWWEGYRGRFVAFRWATTLDDGLGTFLPGHENTSIYNSGEYRSWYGGASLRKYVADLRTHQLDNNWIISVAGHSLGNACVGAALRQGMQVNSYVAMEAAVSLSCYYAESEDLDQLGLTDPSLVRADDPTHGGTPTPRYASELGYQGYLSDIGNSVVNRASYYNADDFWLVTGTLNPDVKWKMIADGEMLNPIWGGLTAAWVYNQIKDVNWMAGQRKYKPDNRYGLGQYKYDSQLNSSTFERGVWPAKYTRPVSDPFEGMAFVARSRTRPLGAIEPPQKYSGMDLRKNYQFDGERSCHSGQFQRNIQLMYGDENGKQWPEPFYTHLMNDLRVGP